MMIMLVVEVIMMLARVDGESDGFDDANCVG